eukprot:TRINITY_DN80769_c0_g1_i1.p1 TRINITY_DN80769_c0_g1~~TRINITY_DN80769_c0_g1_i1.p1  ORF type:complete len:138 (+),score=17.28 TRINITY_DN80769_c0_g1_i1:149-562(+)
MPRCAAAADSCVGVSIGFFAVILLLLLVDDRGHNIFPYYVAHLAVAILIFLFCSGFFYFFVHKMKLADGTWLCGLLGALPFYISREITDYKHLKYWDWPGLWWPTLGLLILWICLEIGTYFWKWRHQQTNGCQEASV